MAVATDQTEGDIVVEGAGEDSGEPEWWVTGVGDGCVEWGLVNGGDTSLENINKAKQLEICKSVGFPSKNSTTVRIWSWFVSSLR